MRFSSVFERRAVSEPGGPVSVHLRRRLGGTQVPDTGQFRRSTAPTWDEHRAHHSACLPIPRFFLKAGCLRIIPLSLATTTFPRCPQFLGHHAENVSCLPCLQTVRVLALFSKQITLAMVTFPRCTSTRRTPLGSLNTTFHIENVNSFFHTLIFPHFGSASAFSKYS